MSLWGNNGHGMGENEALDDATVEALLATAYRGDAPDLVAVSQFLEQVRSFTERPVPAPSGALAEILNDSAPVSSGVLPTAGRRRFRDLRAGPLARSAEGSRTAAPRHRSLPIHVPVVAAALSAVLIAVVMGAGSARLLPVPTHNVVARIVRVVTFFSVSEPRRPDRVSPRPGLSPEAAPLSEDTGTASGGDPSPGRIPRPATGEHQPIGGANGGPAGRSRPGGATAVPTPATTLAPAPAPAPATPAPPPEPSGYSVELSGATGTQATGDPDGHGTAVLDANPGTDPGSDELCLTFAVSGTAPVTSAHLHAGPIGVSGPVVAAFTEPTAGTTTECVTVTDELVAGIRTEPENYYVDVHTTEFPEEALRGQLTR